MQKIIGTPINPNWRVMPQTPDEWKAQVAKAAATVEKGLPAMREALKVRIEAVTIDGVKAFMLTPEVVPPQNRNRLLIHVHGGCYVNGPGESGTGEATMMAGFGGFKVLSVDYRMPPDHPFSRGAGRCDDRLEGSTEDGPGEEYGHHRLVGGREASRLPWC
jgi:acetyl esterase/lipase